MENKHIEQLVIIGAGGHGKVVADAALKQENIVAVNFIDGRYPALSSQFGLDVLGDDSIIPSLIEKGACFIVAIGDNAIRASKYQHLKQLNANIATVVHPAAVISKGVTIGKGSVVLAGAIINADTQVGNNVIVNTGAVIEHDCFIADHCHIAPRSAMTGGCRIGESSLLGVGACVIPGKSIGANTVIGAGATVISNILDNKVAVGIPAR